MKKALKLLLLFIICSLSFKGFSQKNRKQKVDYDKERQYILVDGNYYAKMEKQNYNKIGLIKNYSIRNKEDKELIFFKYSPYQDWNRERTQKVNKEAYTITFINGGGNVYMKKNFGEKGVMKLITKNNLIQNDKIDSESENRFIAINNGRKGTDKKVDNRVSDIEIEANEIVIDGSPIAKFSEKNMKAEDGTDLLKISIYNTIGEKVATATAPVKAASEWLVVTDSDGRTSEILYETPGAKKKLFNWLLIKKYL
tara:strand:+ start:129 stop:890 length:762 start_codon:yes stop_codon:yes gene_type:complete